MCTYAKLYFQKELNSVAIKYREEMLARSDDHVTISYAGYI